MHLLLHCIELFCNVVLAICLINYLQMFYTKTICRYICFQYVNRVALRQRMGLGGRQRWVQFAKLLVYQLRAKQNYVLYRLFPENGSLRYQCTQSCMGAYTDQLFVHGPKYHYTDPNIIKNRRGKIIFKKKNPTLKNT